MLVFTPRITPRIAFAFNLVLKEWLSIDYKLTSCHYILEDSIESKLCYSPTQIADSFWVKPHGLLTEKNIHPVDLELFGSGNDLILFPSTDKKCFPFDIFSAVFYMISRYEEYLPFEPDLHGRFPSELTFVVKNGIERIPIVDVWVQQFYEALRQQFPFLVNRKNNRGNAIHIDVDNAFAHKGKGLIRTGGKLALSLSRFQMRNFAEIAGASLGITHDPFDTYDTLYQLVKKENIQLKWYFHLGNLDKFDRPVIWSNRTLSCLIRQLSKTSNCGIHPSYGVLDDSNLLHLEVVRFERITGHKPTFSRFHFLRFRFPSSFKMLISEGIEADYSLGFSDRVGYRAGTARPFSFFDLTTETEENLTIYPFVAMDSAFNYQLKMSPSSAIETLGQLYDIQEKTGGDFSVVFHNEIISEKKPWIGWSVLFKALVSIMKEKVDDHPLR